jgi:catechol 2,3-dioxygenase-like lactoylglutathione lyase family enzyme
MADGGVSPIESLSAVTLVVTDMAASVAFYETLGFSRRYGGPEEAFTSYTVGTSYLNLQLGGHRGDGVWGRTIFWVTDVDALHAGAVAAGFHPEAEPADAPWGERYFHLRDPDGHELSFARPIGPGDTGSSAS